MRTPVGVLISGRGSNLQALIDAQDALDAYDIRVVVSNVSDAPGLDRAREAGIDAFTIEHKAYGKDREAFEREVDQRLRAHGVEIVALAGFMRVLTPFFVNAWQGALINIHPLLLPAFPGTRTHERALEAGVRLHGCTAHLVINEVDAGPIIGQAAVPVYADDTPERLDERVREMEHTLYPLSLAALAKGESALMGDQALLNAWMRR